MVKKYELAYVENLRQEVSEQGASYSVLTSVKEGWSSRAANKCQKDGEMG